MKRKIKPLIYVFCEGESEIEYVNFLKEKYEDVAVIQKPVKGLFSTADKKFKKGNYSEPALLKDEIRVTCDRIFDCFVSIVSLFMCRAYVGHDF